MRRRTRAASLNVCSIARQPTMRPVTPEVKSLIFDGDAMFQDIVRRDVHGYFGCIFNAHEFFQGR
jgi:hypothetical protein